MSSTWRAWRAWRSWSSRRSAPPPRAARAGPEDAGAGLRGLAPGVAPGPTKRLRALFAAEGLRADDEVKIVVERRLVEAVVALYEPAVPAGPRVSAELLRPAGVHHRVTRPRPPT